MLLEPLIWFNNSVCPILSCVQILTRKFRSEGIILPKIFIWFPIGGIMQMTSTNTAGQWGEHAVVLCVSSRHDQVPSITQVTEHCVALVWNCGKWPRLQFWEPRGDFRCRVEAATMGKWDSVSADVICYPGTHADVLEETRLCPISVKFSLMKLMCLTSMLGVWAKTEVQRKQRWAFHSTLVKRF